MKEFNTYKEYLLKELEEKKLSRFILQYNIDLMMVYGKMVSSTLDMK